MGDGLYKEKYRIDMINWSDEVREKEPGYFCKIATQEGNLNFNYFCYDKLKSIVSI